MIRATTILFSLIILASCKSKQNLQVRPNQIDTQCKVNLNSKAAIIVHYDTSGLQFNWIKIKANINTLKDQKKISFTTSFRIRKDSLIFASITKAGIPFAKLLITKDSLKLIDLFHKKQKTGSFSELESLIGFKLPFNIMQKLLLGKPDFLYFDQGNISTDSLVNYYNNPKQDGFTQRLSFKCDTIELSSVMIEHSGKNISIKYSNPRDINDYLLNKNITIIVKEAEKIIILAEIEIQRVKKFNNLKVPFIIQADYENLD
jgi:hypothetical protein